MKRREFITLLGGAAAAWPLAARAQQPVKVPTIGFLGLSTRSAATGWTAARIAPLRLSIAGARKRGTLCRNRGRIRPFKVDIPRSLRRKTAAIPIVFAAAGDPVEAGLVASLARPGGNVTGLSSQTADLLPSALKSCARLFLACAVWRS